MIVVQVYQLQEGFAKSFRLEGSIFTAQSHFYSSLSTLVLFFASCLQLLWPVLALLLA